MLYRFPSNPVFQWIKRTLLAMHIHKKMKMSPNKVQVKALLGQKIRTTVPGVYNISSLESGNIESELVFLVFFCEGLRTGSGNQGCPCSG